VSTPREHACLRCGYPLPGWGATCPECGAAYNRGALGRVEDLEEIGSVGWSMVVVAWLLVGGCLVIGAARGGLSELAEFFVCVMVPSAAAPGALFLLWRIGARDWTNKQSPAFKCFITVLPWLVAVVMVLFFVFLCWWA
jgi:hypothetical protein